MRFAYEELQYSVKKIAWFIKGNRFENMFVQRIYAHD